MSCFVGISFVGCFILPVRYSEHYKASWMLTLAPLSTPSDLWRGVQSTAFLYIVAPCTLVMLGIATVIWGVSGIFYVLPGFITLLYYVIFYPKPRSGLPLVEEFVQKRAVVGAWLPFVFNILAISVFVGIQFLTYLLNVWVYYAFYCIGTVGGLIGFIYFWTKKTRERIGKMAIQSKIEWTESTWNPVRGCTRVSEGCRFCYAERIAARFSGKGMAYEGLAENTKAGPRWTQEVQIVRELLNEPLKWKKPRRIFVNSMSDLFHEKIELSYIQEVLL